MRGKGGRKPMILPQRFKMGKASRGVASAALGLMLVAFAVVLVQDLLTSHELEYDAVRRDSDNLARVIEREVLTAVEKMDVVLSETAYEFGPVVNDGKSRQRLEANRDLQRWMAFIPEAQKESLRVVDPSGRVVYNAGQTAELPDVVVADRAYFLTQKNNPNAGLVVSEPLLSRFTGKWLITLSRRMLKADGQFGGLVQAALRTEYFQTLFEAVDVGRQGNISLFDTDLRLLSRQPALPEQLGKTINNTQIIEALKQKQITGSYETVSRIDGVTRLFFFRKIEGLPYVVVIGRSPEEFLYNWRQKAYLYGLGYLGLVIAVGGFLVVFQRHTEESRRLVSKVFETSREGIVVTDDQGRIITANKAFTDITGYPVAEAIGQTSDLLKSGRHDIEFYQAMWRALQENGTWRGEIWNRRKDGSIYPELLSINAVRDGNGHATNYIGVFSDITELYNAHQQAQAANRAKGEFLATMSHEIRTPMNGIIGMTGLLMDTALSPDQQHFANTIRVSAESLLSIINDILDFSKIEAGRLEFEECPFDISTLVEGVADILAPKAVGKKLELSVLVAPDLRGEFKGDPGRIRQVLMNLASNAVKFTEQGSVSIQATRFELNGREQMRVDVIDTGVGIPEQAKARLFTMFTQADASTARRFGGSGLGLAISRRIVEMMGGEIGFESVLGQGSRFWFSLPLHRIGDSAPAADLADALKGLRVLVVDDTPANLDVFRGQLQGWGADVAVAPLATDGLNLLRTASDEARPFDVAILDHHMPGMTGIDLASVVRADPKLAGLRLILASSALETGPHNRFAAIAWAAVLTKPVRPSALLDCLALAVGRKDAVEAQVALDAQIPTEGAGATRSLRLLVAEDNAINQQVATGLLSRLGHRADVANDGGEAVVLVERGEYDLVFMDVQMPGMDGIEATKTIRRLSGPKSGVPIVAMTANAMAGDREAFLAAGMDDYISKPISRRALAALLERWSDRLALHGAGHVGKAPSAVEAPAPAPSVVADPGLIDTAAQTELAEELGAERFKGLVARLFESYPARLGEIAAAIGGEDWGAVAKIAHNLKGSSANLGFVALAHAAQALEQAGKAGVGDFPALLETLRQTLKDSQAA